MILEEAVQFLSSFKSEEEANLISREGSRPIALHCKSLECCARRIGVHRQIVGELDGDLHGYKGSKYTMGRPCPFKSGSTRSSWRAVNAVEEESA